MPHEKEEGRNLKHFVPNEPVLKTRRHLREDIWSAKWITGMNRFPTCEDDLFLRLGNGVPWGRGLTCGELAFRVFESTIAVPRVPKPS